MHFKAYAVKGILGRKENVATPFSFALASLNPDPARVSICSQTFNFWSHGNRSRIQPSALRLPPSPVKPLLRAGFTPPPVVRLI